MHFLGVMFIWDMKENTFNAFYKYRNELTLIAVDWTNPNEH
jgi:hypothetical protein